MENRRLKGVGCALAAGFCLLLVCGAGQRSIVATDDLIILDKKGKERLHLGTREAGYPFLSLKDENGQIGIFMLQGPGGATVIGISDPAGQDRIRLGTKVDGYPFLNFSNSKGQENINISESVAFTGMSLVDEKDTLRAGFGMDLGACPVLTFFGDKDPRLGMRVDSNGAPSISLFGKDGMRGFLGVQKQDIAVMMVAGADGEGRAEATAKPNGESYFRVLDPEGKSQFQAPDR